MVMEEVATESVAVEPSMETDRTEVVDMSDEEFSEAFDNDTLDNEESIEEESTEEVDLNTLYRDQLDNTDAKLDKPVLIKVDGEVIELNSINELRDMAERGTAVTKRFQKLAADRKALEAQLEALGEQPNVQTPDEVETVANEILESNYADTFKADIAILPNEVKEMLSRDAGMLKALAVDYESGLAQEVMPKVKREMALKGLDFIQAYVSIGNQIKSHKEDATAKREVLAAEPKQTKYSSPTTDVNSMSDEEFDKYFSNL
jgi:hypothetical protein